MRTAWLFPLMKSRVFFEVMRCSPRISVCIYVMIYIKAKCVNVLLRSRFQAQRVRNCSRSGGRNGCAILYRTGGSRTSWGALFQRNMAPTRLIHRAYWQKGYRLAKIVAHVSIHAAIVSRRFRGPRMPIFDCRICPNTEYGRRERRASLEERLPNPQSLQARRLAQISQ